MPLEVMVANPRYDTSVDEFSYGILANNPHGGGMIPVSEAERRMEFLLADGNDLPLMDLIFKCIHNHPKSRAHASEIGKKLAKMLLQFPAPLPNRLEMMHQLEAERKEKSALTEEREEKARVIQQKEDEITLSRQKLQDEKQ